MVDENYKNRNQKLIKTKFPMTFPCADGQQMDASFRSSHGLKQRDQVHNYERKLANDCFQQKSSTGVNFLQQEEIAGNSNFTRPVVAVDNEIQNTNSTNMIITDEQKVDIIKKVKSESIGKDMENLFKACPVCNKVIKRLER